jgi:mono/diheme cytochrome c family protein
MPYRHRAIVTFGIVGLILVVGAVQPVMGAGNVAAGEKLYQTRCAPCHGPDGKAATPTAQALNPKPRDHTDGAYMNQLSHEHLAKIIKNGGRQWGNLPLCRLTLI